MKSKTNAQRLLEANKIPHQAAVYDPSGAFHSAEEAAQLLGVPVETVFKTLVVLREPPRGKPLLVLLPANRELDLRRLARSLGEKKLRMATQRDAEQLTGLQVGGISALALLNRGFEVCLDREATKLQEIHVSGGMRGVDIRLAVADLVRLTKARIVETLSEAPGEAGREGE